MGRGRAIVTLAQLVSFLNFQIRISTGSGSAPTRLANMRRRRSFPHLDSPTPS